MNKIKYTFYLVLVVLLAISCSTNDLFLAEDVSDAATASLTVEPQYESGYLRVLVTDELANNMESALKNGIKQSDAMATSDVIDQVKIRSVHRTFPYAGRFEERTRKAGLHLWYDVEFDSDISLKTVGTTLSSVRGIKKIEYRPVVAKYWDDKVLEYAQNVAYRVNKASKAVPFNDPQLLNQWHYRNDGSLGDKYKAGADINVFDAWGYTTGSPDVVVAIIDGGIDYTHEDIAANMWVNTKESNGTASFDDDNNGYKDDIYGYNFVSDIGRLVPHNHGTHVAGTVAAVSNNGKGVAGIAGGNGQAGSGVRLMSCQIFVNDDDPYANSGGRKGATAIKYAADNGAVICQNSWGYPTLTETPASDKAAIDYFVQYAGIDENGQQSGAMRGGIVIFAAGNENRTAAAPANYEKVVAVSSIAPDYRKAYYSNYGDWIDIAAPGGDVQSFGNKGTVLSTVVGGYGYMQGTSMACPHVSGVAALVLSHFKRSGYNSEMLRARLEMSSTNIDGYNSSYKGKLGGLVNALGALANGSTIPPNGVGTVSGTVKSNTVKLKWVVPSDPDDGKASGYNVYYRKTPLVGLNVNNLPTDVMVNTFSTGQLNVGDVIEADVNGLDFESTYYFAVNSFDFSGNFSTLSTPVSITTSSNNAPIISVLDSVDVEMKAHQIVVLNFSGIDPDGHEVLWSLENSTSGIALVDLGDGKSQLTITGTKCVPGLNTIKLKLEDKYGAYVIQPITVFVHENHAPELLAKISNLYMGALNKQTVLEISDYFKDQDGEPLKFTFVNSAPNIVNVNESKGKLYIVSLAYGIAHITVKVTDAVGVSVYQEFTVLVRDDNQIIDVYPNPVKDFVWLRTGSESQCTVTIYSNSGAKVFEKNMTISPFSPEKIDLTKLNGGVYNMNVKFVDKDIKKQIIKL